MSLFCLLVCLLFFSQCAWWCPALQMSLFTCFILFPVIWLRLWLVVLRNLDVSLHMSPLICLPVCSGVRLSGCLFCAFTCLSSYVPPHVSPILSLSQLICLQLSVCLPALSPIRLVYHPWFVSHHLSRTSSVSEVSNHMFALVAVSCSSFILIVFSVLIFLFVSLLSQDKIMFHHGFMRFTTPCVPLVSYLVPVLSPIQMLSVATKAKPCALTCDSWCFPINMNQQLPASGASNV